jgi:hypothetical protein
MVNSLISISAVALKLEVMSLFQLILERFKQILKALMSSLNLIPKRNLRLKNQILIRRMKKRNRMTRIIFKLNR